jgi:hypothetical protein
MNAVSITTDAAASAQGETRVPMFGVSEIPMLIERHQEAGFDELVFAPMDDDLRLLDDIERQLGQ